MKCPFCNYPVKPSETVCRFCGMPIHSESHSSKHRWAVIFKLPTERRWRYRTFSKSELAKAHKERLERLGYEARYFPIRFSSSNPQAVTIPIHPMNWVYIGAFMNGESSFSTWIEKGKYLKTMIDITQMDKKIGGYNLLNQIKNFIKKELGIEGTLRAVNNYYHLSYFTHLDCYLLAAAVLPYLHHPKKLEDAERMLKELETYKKQEIRRLQKQIPHLKGIALASARSHLKTEQKHLEQIKEIKRKYPYITMLTG